MTLITLVSPDGTEQIVGSADSTVEEAMNLLKRSPSVLGSYKEGFGAYHHMPSGKRFRVVEIPYVNPYWPDGVSRLEKVIRSLAT